MNYQKELELVLENMKSSYQKGDEPKTLLLHSCCAPCSSYVLEYLRELFCITVFFYNPNISEKVEYEKRVEEQKRFISIMNDKNEGYEIRILEGEYQPQLFYQLVQGLEHDKEGGERCLKCYRQRLEKTAEIASQKGFDYFTTTLTISPLKNAQKLNEIGKSVEQQALYLVSDFKKKNGYKRSTELSREYDLYRQDYCGCIFSKRDRELDNNKKEQ